MRPLQLCQNCGLEQSAGRGRRCPLSDRACECACCEKCRFACAEEVEAE